MFSPFLSNRDPESHKGWYGHALLIAGSYGKMGAAVLAARACLRSGVGLLTVHVPRCGVQIMQTAVPEAMLSIDTDEQSFTVMPSHLDSYDAIAVGPGLGTDGNTQNALLELLKNRNSDASVQLRDAVAYNGENNSGRCPLVLDADALNILSMHPESLHLAEGAVITPHAKEYQRIFADADPQTMADMHGLVIVKKAHRTQIYAPDRVPITNNTGNPGMATAGSGDVLTGIMLGVLTQSKAYAAHSSNYSNGDYSLQQLAALAVSMHGTAGDNATIKRSQASVIASDIIESL